MKKVAKQPRKKERERSNCDGGAGSTAAFFTVEKEVVSVSRKTYGKKRWGACLLALLMLGGCGGSQPTAVPAASTPAVESRTPAPTPVPAPADTQAPVISGARDREVEAGGTISYRDGVTVTDNVDVSVKLQVDASAVDLNRQGLYPVVYSAADSSGNRSEVTVLVSVHEVELPAGSGQPQPPVQPPIPENITQEMVDELADKILAGIVTEEMSLRDKAYAVYRYVYDNIKYVGSSDKSDWLRGAYVGFTYGRGDCYNYFACSKALLTRLGIPNIDLERIPSKSRHYWQLVDVGEGWHHFDACWHPTGYAANSFLITEAEARAYTERVSPVRENYYVYDYESCPVVVEGTPEEQTPQEPVPPEQPAVTEAPAESALPGEQPLPPDPAAPTEEPTPLDPAVPTEEPAPLEPAVPVQTPAAEETQAPVTGVPAETVQPEGQSEPLPLEQAPVHGQEGETIPGEEGSTNAA